MSFWYIPPRFDAKHYLSKSYLFWTKPRLSLVVKKSRIWSTRAYRLMHCWDSGVSCSRELIFGVMMLGHRSYVGSQTLASSKRLAVYFSLVLKSTPCLVLYLYKLIQFKIDYSLIQYDLVPSTHIRQFPIAFNCSSRESVIFFWTPRVSSNV